MTIENRIRQLLQHLQIEHAHFAARLFEDWHGLVTKYPDKVASLMLACPSIDINALAPLGSRLLVFSGDQPTAGTQTIAAMKHLPEARHVVFPEYNTYLWTDMMDDHTQQIGTEMIDFITSIGAASVKTHLTDQRGEVAGITYEIFGSGEPLLLFPLGLAPSGWDPLIQRLSQHFTVIALGGAELGVIPMLEHRGQSSGYAKMMGNMFEAIALITGMDVNAYLLKEATALAAKAGLLDELCFTEGNAEALPFPDASFDVIFSTTVMEEVDADQMLSEMIRVAKPGGRVGVIVRATDMPYHMNIPASPELKKRFEFRQWPSEGEGCASATLYRRFQNSELVDIWYAPQLAIFTDAYGHTERFIQGGFRSQLSDQEAVVWQAAVDQAATEGTFYIAWPHHCAVGQKPLT